MTHLLFGHPPAFYIVAMAVLAILFGLIAFGHAFLGLLRNLRDYRDGN